MKAQNESNEHSDKLLEIYKNEKISQAELDAKIIESREKDYLSHLPEQNKSLRSQLAAILDHLHPEYAKADLLACDYQKLYRRASAAIYMLAALSLIIGSGQSIFNLNYIVGFGEIISIGAILVIITYGNRIGWHRRWVDYRFLAERLRGGIFMAFVSKGRQSQDDDGFPFQWTGNSWIMDYYKTLWETRPELAPSKDSDLPDLKRFLQTALLEGQIDYHRNKKAVELKKHERLSRIGEVLFWLAFIVSILNLLPHMLDLSIDTNFLHHDLSNQILIFAAIAFPSFAFTSSALRAHFEHKKISDRSNMMEINLTHLENRLNKAQDMRTLHLIIRDIEALMIQENADWYVTIGVHVLEPA